MPTPPTVAAETPGSPGPALAADRLLRWTSRSFYFAALAGLLTFGAYIVLRGTGATRSNFSQWRELVLGLPMQTPAAWIANVGIGMHFLMGAILVLAWPVLLSSRIRTRHHLVHRWTGRVYVLAGFLAGVGGLSFMLAHGVLNAMYIAFSIWGLIMMLSAAMAYVHARARRFDLHRAWAIRLFAMVLGSWVFDLEYRAWQDLTGGIGMNVAGDGKFDYAMLYLFFVPNLLVAEYFIRNKPGRIVMPRALKWPAVATLAVVGIVFVYAIAIVTGTQSGKYGKHLFSLFTG